RPSASRTSPPNDCLRGANDISSLRSAAWNRQPKWRSRWRGGWGPKLGMGWSDCIATRPPSTSWKLSVGGRPAGLIEEALPNEQDASPPNATANTRPRAKLRGQKPLTATPFNAQVGREVALKANIRAAKANAANGSLERTVRRILPPA